MGATAVVRKNRSFNHGGKGYAGEENHRAG
jgi:hypothetical protein